MTEFLGVAFGVSDNQLCCLASSDGYALTDMSGIESKAALEFLWTVTRARNGRPVAMFDSVSELELMFRDLSDFEKDTLFGIIQKKEQSVKDTPLYEWQVALKPGVVDRAGYRVSMIPGKLLRLAGPRKSGVSIYDIHTYFGGCDINEAVSYLPDGETVPRIEKNLMPLWESGLREQLAERCITEARVVARLGARIAAIVEPLDLAPRQWYGPSAIAGRCLNKWGARKQGKKLHEKNTVSELLKAIDCAYFGGRVEMIQNGKIKDVRTFDLNSAYAYATTLLAQFHTPLRFTRQYDANAPFSCWLVDYELPPEALLGVLPTRSPRGGISFRGRGRGYFWQPEVDYILKRYPGCAGIRWGYSQPDYEPVTFAGEIEKVYDYRLELKNQGDKGEKIVKLALANLYGKFAQNTGTAYYQCRAWAGWITSLIRRLLLEAVTGIEDRVICFAQDAIHFQGVDAVLAPGRLGSGLGQYKRATFAEGLYVAPGLYELSDGEPEKPDKSATRGANLQLDFERIARDLSDRQVAELQRAFFVGWQMSRQAPLKYERQYLTEVYESLALVPGRIKARNYLTRFDWLKESRTSTINREFSGLLSSRYQPQDSTPTSRIRLKDRGWL